MTGVLVVGEALVDVVVRPGHPPVEHVGGSPANVALGLARLGRETHLLTRFGDDARGHRVREHLEASGVRIVAGSQQGVRTSSAQATLDSSGAATYVFDLEWSLPTTPLPPEPLAVHTGSIAAVLQPGASTVDRILHGAHHHATISYDPNLRPELMGSPEQMRPHVESLVAGADVVKLSEDDALWICPDDDPVDLVATWLRLGPSVVVLTRGAVGALAVCSGGSVTVAAPSIDVVDTVGAGDSFSSGLLDGLWRQGLLGVAARDALGDIQPETLAEVLDHASAVAAVTVSRPGADPPTLADLTP